MRLLDPRGHHPAREVVTEKVFADINGVRQGMFIQRADPGRPVLLFLHGGLPEYFLTDRYPTGLDNDFTVAWWEQRGAGLSYSPTIPTETMTAEQFIADTLSVTDYLRNRFDQEKIYLMAHSGGTFIGLQAAARLPEAYHAYIGVAQVVDQRKSETLAYEYMLERFRQDGDRGMARRLEAAPVTMEDGPPRRYLAVRDRAMHTLGVGTTRDMNSVLRGVVWPSLLSTEFMSRVVPTPSVCMARSRTARYRWLVPSSIVTGAASSLRTMPRSPSCLNRSSMYSYASISDFR